MSTGSPASSALILHPSAAGSVPLNDQQQSLVDQLASAEISQDGSSSETPKGDRWLRAFLQRTKREPEQVFRYLPPSSAQQGASSSDPRLLWVAASGQAPVGGPAPPCELCGMRRQAEFQVLPQLLFHLGVDRSAAMAATAAGRSPLDGGALDWGILTAYVCQNPQCDPNAGLSKHGTVYAREFLFRQDIEGARL
jgi:hypothetical protein